MQFLLSLLLLHVQASYLPDKSAELKRLCTWLRSEIVWLPHGGDPPGQHLDSRGYSAILVIFLS